jgi:hypothetical protein
MGFIEVMWWRKSFYRPAHKLLQVNIFNCLDITLHRRSIEVNRSSFILH